MTSLIELQRTIQHYLTDGGEQALQLIAGEDPGARLGIYGNAYRLRLQEALGINFPKLHWLLGDDAFDQMTKAYIKTHPSQNPNVRWFGGSLPDFLSRTDPYAGQPVLAEMAAFEWALATVFDAADDARAVPEDMMAVEPAAWGDIRLDFHPSVQLLNLSWNAPRIWTQLEQDEGEAEPDVPARGDVPVSWLLWRQPDLLQRWRSLSVDEAWALSQAQKGRSFAELCAGLEEWIDAQNLALHAAGMLKLWLTDGLVSRVRAGPVSLVS